jgi:hypothetical protein
MEESHESKVAASSENAQHGVHKFFQVLHDQRPAPELTEDQLKSSSTERSTKAIFVSDSFAEAYKNLPAEKKELYKWYGEEYYSRLIDEAQDSVERAAKQALLTIKSGLLPRYLTADELVVLRNIYGEDWYLDCGYTSESYEEEMKAFEEEEKKKQTEKTEESEQLENESKKN